MEKGSTTLRRHNALVWAFLIPVIAMLTVMLFSGYKPFGSAAILYSDMYHQYYPFFAQYHRVLRSGGSLLRDWSVGMGMDYLSLISYYLASPLYLLSVLVPEKLLFSYFCLLVPIKLGFAGLFFGIFLKDLFRREDWSIPLFASFYATCAWAMGYLWNIMWLDTFALLPLVALGTIRLLRDRKFVLYTVSLFFAIFSNYYIGFFVCIFVALLFFCYELTEFPGFLRFFKDLGRIAFFSLLAIGMTAALELPAFMGLQNTYSSTNKFPTGVSLNITSEKTWAGFFDAFRQVAGNIPGGNTPTYKEGLPNLYCGVFSVLLGLVFFTRKEIKFREKLCAGFLLVFFMVSFIVRQLDYIWHGFHFTNMIPYRFSFLFSFVLLVMAYRAFRYLHKIRLWQIVFALATFAGLCWCSNNRLEPEFLAYNIGFALAYGGLLVGFWWNQRSGGDPVRLRQIGAGVLALELACNMVLFGVTFSGTNVSNYPSGTTDTEKVIEYMKAKEEDTLFYRAEFTKTQSLNDGALNGIHGITTFSSSANENMTKFMAALGFGAKPSYNRYAFEEASPVANAFLNLEYLISRDGNVLPNDYFLPIYQSGSVTLLENLASLPLGFLTRPELADLDFSGSDSGSFAFQNRLLTSATGLPAPAYSLVSTMTVEGNDCQVTQKGTGGSCSYTAEDSSATFTIRFEVNTPGFVCLKINAPKRNTFTIYRNGEFLGSDTISLTQMAAVGSCEAGDCISVEFTCKKQESGTLDLTAAILDHETFTSALEYLRQSPLELTAWSETRITGTIHADYAGLLYTSIPYDSGWSATVDGEAVQITPVGNAMVAFPLSQGEHEVEISYENRAFSLGSGISLVSGALFLGVCVHSRRKSWRI